MDTLYIIEENVSVSLVSLLIFLLRTVFYKNILIKTPVKLKKKNNNNNLCFIVQYSNEMLNRFQQS